MSKVPDLPGKLVPRGSEQESWLRSFVGNLCGLSHDRFPGSQPVSFGKKDIDRLELNDYWVCEKSDGVRVLLTVFTNDQTNEQLVHIVDRHNNYRAIEGIFFPHYEFPERPLRNTIVDAELVIDTDPTSGKETLRMLCFDCLVADNVNVMSKTLEGRYGRLQRHFYEPYAKLKRDFPEMAARHPFDIKVKEVNLSYHLEKVFNIDIPKLQHGNDGLIYTPVATPYVTGTDKNILKWKPPSENSIDFKLVLRFPSLKGQRQPDLHAKPIFALHVWCGGEGSRAVYEPYDVMHVEDDEWENLKSSGEQVDDRIVEVHWDPAGENWRMMRFRDDKPHGNHRNTVESIIQSIADGVERDVLLARLDAVRNAWKLRHDRPAKPNTVQQQQQSQQPHQQAPPPPTQQRASPNLSRVMRFGPLAPSLYSKVGGPALVGNIHR